MATLGSFCSLQTLPSGNAQGVIVVFVVDHLAAEHGAEDDLDVQRHGPVFDVPDVVADALGNVGIAAQAVDLRPAVQPGRTCWRTR